MGLNIVQVTMDQLAAKCRYEMLKCTKAD